MVVLLFEVFLAGDILQRKKLDKIFREPSNIFKIADDILVAGYNNSDTDNDWTPCRVLQI